jgi:DNA-binding LacI/PurR family transcriptional regulator
LNRKPTVYDVAERAGVSIATVSFALRRPDKVREATRQTVLAAARELGYVPNVMARGLAHGRTGALGLYSFDYLRDYDSDPQRIAADGLEPAEPRGHDNGADPWLFPLYVDEVQRGVELECWRRGYALMIGGSNPAGSGAVVTDIAGRVDGLAVFPRTVPADVVHHIARRIPVVELSEPDDDDRLSHVTVDNSEGMRAVTAHLIEAHGLRDVMFVGTIDGAEGRARFAGFRAALRRAGLPVPRRSLAAPGGAVVQADAVVRELRERDRLPQGLVCITDQDAIALIERLHADGIEVPGEVAVTGFDGIIAGRLVSPALTTVRQPMQLLGRTVVEVLLDLIATPGSAPRNEQLPCSLVVRQSCGCRDAT